MHQRSERSVEEAVRYQFRIRHKVVHGCLTCRCNEIIMTHNSMREAACL